MEVRPAHVAREPPETDDVGAGLAGIAEEYRGLVGPGGVLHPLDLLGCLEVDGGAVDVGGEARDGGEQQDGECEGEHAGASGHGAAPLVALTGRRLFPLHSMYARLAVGSARKAASQGRLGSQSYCTVGRPRASRPNCSAAMSHARAAWCDAPWASRWKRWMGSLSRMPRAPLASNRRLTACTHSLATKALSRR